MTTQTTPKILTRDFVLVFFAQFAFTSVFHILIPTLPIYLSRLGSTEAEIGVLIGIFFFSSLVLRPFVGRALLKIPRKKLYDRWCPPLCPHFRCLSFRSPFLASFDREDLSRNWIRILPYCLIYIDRQYQLRGPSGAKPQLFLSGHQPLRCLSSFPRNVPYQPL